MSLFEKIMDNPFCAFVYNTNFFLSIVFAIVAALNGKYVWCIIFTSWLAFSMIIPLLLMFVLLKIEANRILRYQQQANIILQENQLNHKKINWKKIGF